MCMLDLTDVKELPKFELIPDGTYLFEIDEAEIKPTKSGEGEYLKIRLTCLTKGFEKKKCWEIFNIHNKSEKAQNIGRSQLKSMLTAAGKEPKLNDPKELIGLKVSAHIGTQESSGFNPKNIVLDWVQDVPF